MEGKWISYLRVSTGRQGRSGLGLEAQRAAVESYLNGGNWKLVKEFVEVESGKNDDRPVLAQALKACRLYGAKLAIAKLDRLSRDAHFLLGLVRAIIKVVPPVPMPLSGSGTWFEFVPSTQRCASRFSNFQNLAVDRFPFFSKFQN
jgi:hypothetical protein